MIYKNPNPFKLLFNVVTADLRHPSYRGISKQVVVARNEIRAIRMVVKQLPEQLYSDAHCHGGARLLFWMASPTQFFLFRNTLLTLLWSLFAWILPSALLPCPRKRLPSIIFLADVCLHFFGLSVNVCASTALTAFRFQHSQMNSRFHHLSLVRWNWEIHSHLCGIALKNLKPKPFSAFRAHPLAFSEPALRKTCDSNSITDNFVVMSEWKLRKFKRKFWNCEAPSFTFFSGQHFQQDHHYIGPADHITLHPERLFTHLNILRHCLTIPSLITFWL
jgi:hypothetical protein